MKLKTFPWLQTKKYEKLRVSVCLPHLSRQQQCPTQIAKRLIKTTTPNVFRNPGKTHRFNRRNVIDARSVPFDFSKNQCAIVPQTTKWTICLNTKHKKRRRKVIERMAAKNKTKYENWIPSSCLPEQTPNRHLTVCSNVCNDPQRSHPAESVVIHRGSDDKSKTHIRKNLLANKCSKSAARTFDLRDGRRIKTAHGAKQVLLRQLWLSGY